MVQESQLKNTVWHIQKLKSKILYDLVELSYSMECEPTEEDSINLERIIAREKIWNCWEH